MQRKPQNQKRISKGRWFAIILLLGFIVLAAIAWRTLFGHPSFNPDKVAHAETEMWRAYYAGDKFRLAAELVLLFRNQYGLSWPEATRIGKFYAEAAMKFQAAQGDYSRAALPDLVQAYTGLKQATSASFDAEAVARAELAWWIARRTPGQNSAEQVGKKIAELYCLLYGRTDASLQSSGLLRAQAAAGRDAEAEEPDWVRVEALLRQSYRALEKAR